MAVAFYIMKRDIFLIQEHDIVRRLPGRRNAGRAILNGAKEVNIFGESVPVRCNMVNIPGYSAHADQPHLLKWLSSMRSSLKKVFVVQGDQSSSEVLMHKIEDDLALIAEVPTTGESVGLRILYPSLCSSVVPHARGRPPTL